MTPPPPTKGPGLGRKLLFAVVPFVVLFGGAEAGLLAAGWPTVDGAFAHNEVFWTADANSVDKKYPHNEENRTFLVSTDANGLRAPLHDQDKRPGTWRVMTLGCSTTFGWGVADAESYPAVLQQRIGDPAVEVINGGQPGYTSFQGRMLWDSVLKHYEPDVVLVGYVVQDARKAAYSDKAQAILQQDSRFMKENLLYKSKTYLFLRQLLGHVQVRTKERTDGGEAGVYRVGEQDYIDNLKGFISAIQAAGAEPVLFGYPLERSGYTSRHRALMQATAEAVGVKHFDPQAQMETASNGASLYWPRDKGHANAAGNALIAEWVHGYLEKVGLLGPGGAK